MEPKEMHTIVRPPTARLGSRASQAARSAGSCQSCGGCAIRFGGRWLRHGGSNSLLHSLRVDWWGCSATAGQVEGLRERGQNQEALKMLRGPMARKDGAETRWGLGRRCSGGAATLGGRRSHGPHSSWTVEAVSSEPLPGDS
jgi:hypothetical protein